MRFVGEIHVDFAVWRCYIGCCKILYFCASTSSNISEDQVAEVQNQNPETHRVVRGAATPWWCSNLWTFQHLSASKTGLVLSEHWGRPGRPLQLLCVFKGPSVAPFLARLGCFIGRILEDSDAKWGHPTSHSGGNLWLVAGGCCHVWVPRNMRLPGRKKTHEMYGQVRKVPSFNVVQNGPPNLTRFLTRGYARPSLGIENITSNGIGGHDHVDDWWEPQQTTWVRFKRPSVNQTWLRNLRTKWALIAGKILLN